MSEQGENPESAITGDEMRELHREALRPVREAMLPRTRERFMESMYYRMRDMLPDLARDLDRLAILRRHFEDEGNVWQMLIDRVGFDEGDLMGDVISGALDERDRLRKRIDGVESQARWDRVAMEHSRDQANRLREERNGSVWLWQGDGTDDIDSLACPVLFTADQLRDLFKMFKESAEADFRAKLQADATAKRLRTALVSAVAWIEQAGQSVKDTPQFKAAIEPIKEALDE